MRPEIGQAHGMKEHAAVRLEPADMARVDALAEKVKGIGHKTSRSDVMRAAILRGLPSLEAEHWVTATEPKAKRRGKGPVSK